MQRRCVQFMRATFVIIFAFILYSGKTQIVTSNDSTYGSFGIACGIGGEPEKSTVLMISLVNRNEKAKLLTLLESENPQNKIHGYVGLFFYEKNGHSLSHEEKKKMKEAQNS